MQKIVPCLWFEERAEEALEFYTSVFEGGKVVSESRYPGGPLEGQLLTAVLELEGQRFMILNGGPQFTFNEAVSFHIGCKDQTEIDYYWEKLSEGGDPAAQQCGWLKDKYGVSWQIVPTAFDKWFGSGDGEAAARVMETFMPMKKLDIAALQKAYENKS